MKPKTPVGQVVAIKRLWVARDLWCCVVIDHFSGPGKALGPVCVCVCVCVAVCVFG